MRGLWIRAGVVIVAAILFLPKFKNSPGLGYAMEEGFGKENKADRYVEVNLSPYLMQGTQEDGEQIVTKTDAIETENIVLQLNQNTEISRQIMNMAKGYGVDMNIGLPNGFTWEIPCHTIKNNIAENIDLGVFEEENIIPEELLNEVGQVKDYLELTMRHKGEFDFQGRLKLPVPDIYKGWMANLFYYKSSDQSLIHYATCPVKEDSTVSFQISRGFDCVLLFTSEPVQEGSVFKVEEKNPPIEIEPIEIINLEGWGTMAGLIIAGISILCLIFVMIGVFIHYEKVSKDYLDEEADDYKEKADDHDTPVVNRAHKYKGKDYLDEEVDDYREKS